MGSVKVMGRDSGPKGAYAHQYLDRENKTKTLKPKAILSLKSPLTHWRGVRKVSPQARLERSSDSSLAALWVKCKKTLTGDSRAFRWHSQIRV